MPRHGDLNVGEPIVMSYRCSGNPTTADPTAVVLDEGGALFATLTVGSGIEYTGQGRTYKATFTPDEIGDWVINITDSNGGDASKSYAVNTHGLGYVVEKMAMLEQALADLALILQGLENEVANSGDGGSSIG